MVQKSGTDDFEQVGDGNSVVTFTAFFRGTPYMTNNLKYRAAALQNAMAIGKTESINRIFEAGLTQLEKEYKGEVDEMDAAFAAKNQELDRVQQIMANLTRFYANMQPEEFVAFCEENNVPNNAIEKFLEQYTWRNTDQKWTSRAHDFLHELLLDGNMRSTKEIRELAITQGIIEDNPLEWQRLRTLASRDGLTNCPQHGYWQYKGLSIK